MVTVSSTVSGFSAALDAEDYGLARCYLTDDCVYDSPTGEIVGPAARVSVPTARSVGQGDDCADHSGGNSGRTRGVECLSAEHRVRVDCRSCVAF